MSLSVEISDEAQRDLELQHLWYASKAGWDVAERYISAFNTTLGQISRRPDCGRLRHFVSPVLADIRSIVLARPFHVHLAFYREVPAGIQIFGIIHGMRDLPKRLLEPPV